MSFGKYGLNKIQRGFILFFHTNNKYNRDNSLHRNSVHCSFSNTASNMFHHMNSNSKHSLGLHREMFRNCCIARDHSTRPFSSKTCVCHGGVYRIAFAFPTSWSSQDIVQSFPYLTLMQNKKWKKAKRKRVYFLLQLSECWTFLYCFTHLGHRTSLQ